MRCWIEIEKDAFRFFEWLSKDNAIKILGYEPAISVLSINGSMLFCKEDRDLFIQKCSESVKRFVLEKSIHQQFHFFLFGINEVYDMKSKIQRHQKLWKKTKKTHNIAGFNLGPEVEYDNAGRLCYTSAAEFSVDQLSNALNIVRSNPNKFAIFASKNQHLLTEDCIKSIFEKIYLAGGEEEKIDYLNLALIFCMEGDFIFRWGDSSEECELDILALESNMQMFQGFTIS